MTDAPKQIPNDTEKRAAVEKAVAEVMKAEAEIAPIRERIKEIKRDLKTETGIPWAHIAALKKLRALVDDDESVVRETLFNMQLAAQALDLLPEGDDLFSVSPGADTNPEAAEMPF